MRADGTGLQRLTAGALDDEHAWSPDGARILFVRMSKPGRAGEKWCSYLYTMAADGTDLQSPTECLPDHGYTKYYPAWSPEGGRIAIIRQTIPEAGDPREDVWAVDLGDGRWENFTRDEDRFTDYFGLDW